MKVLVRLLSIEQIIKDANSMCISFSVKHPQTFQKSWLSLPNMSRTISSMYTYPFNPQLLIKTLVESYDKKPKDCFSIKVWAVMQNIYFFILLSFCMLVSIFLQFLNALTCSPVTIFFKCLKFEESFPKILISRQLMQKRTLWHYILKKCSI